MQVVAFCSLLAQDRARSRLLLFQPHLRLCVWLCVAQADAAPGFVLTLCTLTVWMKLVSYAHCHHDLRAAHRANLLRPGERGAPGAAAACLQGWRVHVPSLCSYWWGDIAKACHMRVLAAGGGLLSCALQYNDCSFVLKQSREGGGAGTMQNMQPVSCCHQQPPGCCQRAALLSRPAVCPQTATRSGPHCATQRT